MTHANENRKVLDMLAEGKIDANQAQQLLEKLSGSTSGREADTATATAADSNQVRTAVLVSTPGDSQKTTMPKFLRIRVDSPKGDDVNIQIPLQLARAGIKLATVLPTNVRLKIQENGIDLSELSELSELNGEELATALRELSIHVTASGGEVIRVYCE